MQLAETQLFNGRWSLICILKYVGYCCSARSQQLWFIFYYMLIDNIFELEMAVYCFFFMAVQAVHIYVLQDCWVSLKMIHKRLKLPNESSTQFLTYNPVLHLLTFSRAREWNRILTDSAHPQSRALTWKKGPGPAQTQYHRGLPTTPPYFL